MYREVSVIEIREVLRLNQLDPCSVHTFRANAPDDSRRHPPSRPARTRPSIATGLTPGDVLQGRAGALARHWSVSGHFVTRATYEHGIGVPFVLRHAFVELALNARPLLVQVGHGGAPDSLDVNIPICPLGGNRKPCVPK